VPDRVRWRESDRLAAMRFILLLGLVCFVVVPCVMVLLRQRPLASKTPVDRNHLAMARWIERQLGDDLVRVTVPEAQRQLAEQLLVEFYGDDDHRSKELPS